MAAVGQMAAGVAHEINNPLASIATSAEILSDAVETADADVAPAKERLEKHLRRIQDNAYRCEDIIQRLMDFARGEIEDLTRVDLRELVADTVALVNGDARCKCRQLAITNQPLAPLGDVDFAHLEALEETDASAQPALEGWTRPRVLQQVFLNLLLNALDATPEDGRIAVACVPKDDGVEVAVADDGTGIEPEHVGRVFDAFFTTKPPGKGSGLGLNLTRQIVRSLEGTVTVESEHGRGTIMRVWLPLDPRQVEQT